MTTRLYKPEDHATVSWWWMQRKLAVVPLEALPKCGVVVEDDKGPMAAAWIYQDNSTRVAWMAWLVTRPGLTGKDPLRALGVLLGGCEVVARELGYRVFFTMTQHASLGRWLQANGFQGNHSGMKQYFKELK